MSENYEKWRQQRNNPPDLWAFAGIHPRKKTPVAHSSQPNPSIDIDADQTAAPAYVDDDTNPLDEDDCVFPEEWEEFFEYKWYWMDMSFRCCIPMLIVFISTVLYYYKRF